MMLKVILITESTANQISSLKLVICKLFYFLFTLL